MPTYVHVALALVLAAPLAAQQPGHVDPAPVLERVAKAMGVDKISCISFSGTGYAGMVGQNVTQDTDWPLGAPLENYTRTIDFASATSVETFERPPGLNPRSWKYGSGWRSGTTFQRHRRQTFAVSGKHAWHTDGEGEPFPAPSQAELWQLDMWMNPHGFVHAARRPGANLKAIWRWELPESGRDGAATAGIEKVVVLSATVLGRYRVNATVNHDNYIQRVQTWIPHPVLGDMNYEHEYNDWREVGGAVFPAWWHHHDGWDDERQVPLISGGHNSFGGEFPDMRATGCDTLPPVPESVRRAEVESPAANSEKLADGVWLIGGGSHNSVAVEFDQFIAVVEAPINEARSLAVIDEVVRLVPDKPIRFLINTHSHFDSLGGIRTYMHIGATILTHQRNRLFYESEVLNLEPRTLQPDLMSLHPPTEVSEGYTMEDVDEKYVLTDRNRHLELYYAQGLANHAEGMLMAYLPNERILIEADLFSPTETNVAPERSAPLYQALINNVRQIGLDVQSIAPLNGAPTPWKDFLKIAKSAGCDISD